MYNDVPIRTATFKYSSMSISDENVVWIWKEILCYKIIYVCGFEVSGQTVFPCQEGSQHEDYDRVVVDKLRKKDDRND